MARQQGATGKKTRVAVVCPDDIHTRQTIERCEREGWAEFIRVEGEPAQAARTAVAAVRSGQADVLMKGLISSDILLRAILDKTCGLLPEGNVLSHIAVAEIPSYHKMLMLSDVAVIPYPTERQMEAMVKSCAAVCRKFGTERPKAALIHCNEHTSEKFPVTLAYRELKEKAAQGMFGDLLADGPMDVKTACDARSAQIKEIESTVSGDADILLFPDIEAGNTFYKTITTLAGARTACMLTGTFAPVVMPSRADTAEAKHASLALACVMAAR